MHPNISIDLTRHRFAVRRNHHAGLANLVSDNYLEPRIDSSVFATRADPLTHVTCYPSDGPIGAALRDHRKKYVWSKRDSKFGTCRGRTAGTPREHPLLDARSGSTRTRRVLLRRAPCAQDIDPSASGGAADADVVVAAMPCSEMVHPGMLVLPAQIDTVALEFMRNPASS